MAALGVYIIVPAYNEQEMIRQTAEQLIGKGYEIVIVDDGSFPDLYNIIAGLPVHYLRHELNLGQGAALQTGTEFALRKGAAFIVHFDADGQHDRSDIPSLLEPLQQNKADISLGSRFINKSFSKTPGSRKLVINMARVINFLFTGLLLTDAHNGMRAMTARAASLITITENRMAHASEILFMIKKHQIRVLEVPVHIYYTTYSTKKGQPASNGFRVFFDLVLHKLFK